MSNNSYGPFEVEQQDYEFQPEKPIRPINDGGPAFPCKAHLHHRDTDPSNLPGMSLRDWFAGRALKGYLSNRISMAAAVCESKEKNVEFSTYLARLSYEMADAMIASRNNQPSQA